METYLELNLPTETLQIDYFWLRDHCRCNLCYNHETFQRKVSLSDIPDDVTVIGSTLEGELFDVVWSDKHKSSYDLAFLRKYTSLRLL